MARSKSVFLWKMAGVPPAPLRFLQHLQLSTPDHGGQFGLLHQIQLDGFAFQTFLGNGRVVLEFGFALQPEESEGPLC